MKKETKPLVLYRDNPHRKANIIPTFDGSLEYQTNCISYNSMYYRKYDQIILINKKWIPINSPMLIYDYFKKEYLLKSSFKFLSLCEGVVEYSEGKFLRGFFTRDPFKNCRICYIQDNQNTVLECMSYEIPKSLGFIEHINEGTWASEEYLGTFEDFSYFTRFGDRSYRLLNSIYNNSKDDFKKKKKYSFESNSYNVEDANNFQKAISLYESYNSPLTKDVKKAARLIGDLKFGCEIECKLGNLSNYTLNQLGVLVCRDGSIGYTPEFVTVPYTGAKGLDSLNTLFLELNKRCTTDHTCSLHYHIGNVRKDREFIIALYKVYSDIQKDLHKILPFYKTVHIGIKKQNYCQFLNPDLIRNVFDKKKEYKERINIAYNNLYTWILEGRTPDKNFNRKNMQHPNGDRKWNLHSRYFSLNLLNLFVSNRQTYEFRAHHAVLSSTKAINWLFICIAIIRYTEKNSSRILVNRSKISLKEVLNYYGENFKSTYAEKVSEYLIDYVDNRTNYFKNKTLLGDKLVEEDFTNELDYSFDNGILKSIF